MFNLQDSIENIKKIFSEIKMKTLLISILIVFMTLCAIAVLLFQRNKPRILTEQKKLVLDQSLLVPKGPAVPDDYITSRKTPEKWNEDDVEKWFTLPDNHEVKKLGESNDKIIDEIIGDAP